MKEVITRLFQFTIRAKLWLLAINFLVAAILLSILTRAYTDRIFEYKNAAKAVRDISTYTLTFRKAEQGFLVRELNNPYFYETGQSVYVKDFERTKIKLDSMFFEISFRPMFQDEQIQEKLAPLRYEYFYGYVSAFYDLVTTVKELGYQKYGKIGDMYEVIHQVEHMANLLNNKVLFNYVLTLRKHEKDFLLNKDEAYVTKFQNTLNDILLNLEEVVVNEYDRRSISDKVTEYEQLFLEVVDYEREIGLTDKVGYMGALYDYVNKIEPSVDSLVQLIDEISETQVRALHRYYYSIIVLFILLGVTLILAMSKAIVPPLRAFGKYLEVISIGVIPEKPFERRVNDEIKEAGTALNSLTERLRHIAEFANRIGEGELGARLDLQNEQDVLGNALSKMRSNLLQAKDKEQARKEEDTHREWSSKGQNLFNDIMRQGGAHLETISGLIIKELVKYLRANQGGIFILDNEKAEGVCLDLAASYAYNREKFLQKRILLNEGLVGACAAEKRTIFVTEVPVDYLAIESGMGRSRPACLLVCPIQIDEEVLGVIELASFEVLEDFEIQFVEQIALSLASTLSHSKATRKTEELVNELKQQSESLSAQEEEMRQSMEMMQSTHEEEMRQEEKLRNELDRAKTEIARLREQID